MTVHSLGREAIHTVWDASLPPALTVRPGDTVVLETLDASYGSVARRVAAGELSGTGIEMEGRLTLRLTVLKDRLIASPQFRAPPEPTALWSQGSYAATGHAPDLMDAARAALHGLLLHMTREYGLSMSQAYVLSSACVDLRVSQIVDAPNYTVSALLPLSVFG